MGDEREIRIAKGRTLLDKHGLQDWQINFADLSGVQSRNLVGVSFGANGVCQFWSKSILISPKLVQHRNKFLNTVLHEIAHGLAGPLAGHGPRWLKIARKIGCSKRHLSVYRERLKLNAA